MTGRKGRVVRCLDGSVRYESRAEQGLTIDHINIKEKDRFMGAEKVRYANQIDINDVLHLQIHDLAASNLCLKEMYCFINNVQYDVHQYPKPLSFSWWPSSQRRPALGFPCRRTSEWKTRSAGSTWLWSCLGVQTGPFSNLVSQEM